MCFIEEVSIWTEIVSSAVYKRFDSFMIKHNFNRYSYDNCVYFKRNKNGSFIYLLLYVDDMLVVSKDKDEIKRLKTQINKEFEMKDLNATKKILEMQISRERKTSKLYLSQKGYVKKVLTKFNM